MSSLDVQVEADEKNMDGAAQILYEDLNSSHQPFPIRTPVDVALKKASSICVDLGLFNEEKKEGINGLKLIAYLEKRGYFHRDRREYVVSDYCPA